MKVFARREPYSNKISIAAIVEHANGRSVGLPLVMQDIGHDVVDQPTLQLDNDDAQFLMDELWQCGLRPSEGTGSAGQLAATLRHLDDVRTLLFNAQGIAKP